MWSNGGSGTCVVTCAPAECIHVRIRVIHGGWYPSHGNEMHLTTGEDWRTCQQKAFLDDGYTYGAYCKDRRGPYSAWTQAGDITEVVVDKTTGTGRFIVNGSEQERFEVNLCEVDNLQVTVRIHAGGHVELL